MEKLEMQTYSEYCKSVSRLWNRTYDGNRKLVESGLMVSKEFNTNGEPYRELTEEEFKSLNKR